MSSLTVLFATALFALLSKNAWGFSCIACNNLPLEDDSEECVERVETCMPGVTACSSVVFKDEKGVVHRRKFCTASGTPMYQQLAEFPGSSMCQNIESKPTIEPIRFALQTDNVPSIDLIPPQSFQLPPLDNPLPHNEPILRPRQLKSRNRSNSESSADQSNTVFDSQQSLGAQTSSILTPPGQQSEEAGGGGGVNIGNGGSSPPAGLNKQAREKLLKGAQGPVQKPGINVALRRRSRRQSDGSPGSGAPGGVLPPAMNPHRPASTSKHISTLICVCTKEKCNSGDYPETVNNILMQNIDKPVPKKDSAVQTTEI